MRLTGIVITLSLLLIISCSPFNRKGSGTVLNISAKDIENIKENIATDDWVCDRWSKIMSVAGKAADDTSTVVLPERGGNWPHFYVDPDEGKPLVAGKYLGDWHWEHYNQDHTKTYYSTDSIYYLDYDGVLIQSQVHGAWADKLFALSLAWKVEKDKRYISRVIDILGAYNRVYTRIPPHNKAGGNDYDYETGVGRIGAQALDESVWLTKMLQGISLIWDDLDPGFREETEKYFLYPAARMIMRCHNLGIQNISNWYNAVVGMTGYLTSNDSLIQWALLEDGRGLKYQIENGFTPDGHWYENAPHYHFYALQPIILLAECAKNNGDNSFTGAIEKFLNAPLQLMMPDMKMPMFNDSQEVWLPGYGSYYEYGYTRFRDETYLPILNRHRSEQRRRVSWNFNFSNLSDLYIEPIDTNNNKITLESRHLDKTGFDVLVSGEGDKITWMGIKYDLNNKSGWHMHPDALNFVLYSRNHIISPDPGTARYGARSHNGWDKSTLAHNALVINQKNQNFRKPVSLAFGEVSGIKYSMCRTDSAYNGVSHTRAYLLIDPGTVVIADWIQADSLSLMDIGYHQEGTWKSKGTGEKWNVPEADGYRFLKDTEILGPGRSHSFSTVIDETEVPVQLSSSQSVSLITATGIGYNFKPVPCVIARYKGTRLLMVWTINTDGGRDKVGIKFPYKKDDLKVRLEIKDNNIILDPAGNCTVIQV